MKLFLNSELELRWSGRSQLTIDLFILILIGFGFSVFANKFELKLVWIINLEALEKCLSG